MYSIEMGRIFSAFKSCMRNAAEIFSGSVHELSLWQCKADKKWNPTSVAWLRDASTTKAHHRIVTRSGRTHRKLPVNKIIYIFVQCTHGTEIVYDPFSLQILQQENSEAKIVNHAADKTFENSFFALNGALLSAVPTPTGKSRDWWVGAVVTGSDNNIIWLASFCPFLRW